MRILLVGAGGVGDAVAKIAAERDFYELFVISDYDQTRAERTLDWIADRHGEPWVERCPRKKNLGRGGRGRQSSDAGIFQIF